MDSGEKTAPGARPLLFVSYSRTDLARARPVIELLEQSDFEVWWDGKLEGGENYLQTTETALETCACVVVLWSATSVASHWVRDEAQRGRERGCLVPLTIDGTMAPLGFRQFQLLDISAWDGRVDSAEAARILVAVRARIGEAGAAPMAPVSPPPPLPPAAGPAVSRRNLVIGSVAGAAALGLAGAWQFGLFGSPASAATSMVVMPFANETGDPDKKFFSDGLARELRTLLARNPRLKVAAPTSSTAIAGEDDFEIGRKLGVGSILRGSVQRDNARVRVAAELVAIEGGTVLWAETYDRALEDVFAVQSEIARTVALSLVAGIASDSEARQSLAAQKDVGGTKNVAAYEAFLRGMALYDLGAGPETDRAALVQFEAAIAQDADYAAAHAMRATMLSAIANAASDQAEVRALYDKAIGAAERAIALEPKLAQGHVALGFVLNNGQLNRRAALPHYQAAEKLGAGDADTLRSVAIFYSFGAEQAEERDKAKRIIAEVLKLDPLNARAFRSAGNIALFRRDYPAVIGYMNRALELNPSLVSAQSAIAVARLMQGDAAGSLAAAKAEKVPLFRLTGSAIALARLGDTAAADAEFARLIVDYGDAALYQQAQVQAQRGALAAALDALERAYAVRDPGLLWIRNDPMLDPLRGEARFKDLLSRLGS
ncbi:TIR domain-containing protein [Erythrobacter oryzae]|uniref:TIR domain-containing protein n=1 Tax=Erythrobacter oryzae TaxID=3019556 RepID=UPI002557875D|nr:TIR domain-containing protein [Erythrobacter sp. COR-2]